jgi:hypothetical protein
MTVRAPMRTVKATTRQAIVRIPLWLFALLSEYCYNTWVAQKRSLADLASPGHDRGRIAAPGNPIVARQLAVKLRRGGPDAGFAVQSMQTKHRFEEDSRLPPPPPRFRRG